MTSDAIESRELGTEIEKPGHPVRSTREHEIRVAPTKFISLAGAQPGRELEDWLQAERELTAEENQSNDHCGRLEVQRQLAAMITKGCRNNIG